MEQVAVLAGVFAVSVLRPGRSFNFDMALSRLPFTGWLVPAGNEQTAPRQLLQAVGAVDQGARMAAGGADDMAKARRLIQKCPRSRGYSMTT